MMVTVEKIMKTRRGVEVKLYPFFNLEVGDQRRALAHLSPGKETLYSYRRLGKPQGRSGRVRKLSPQRDSIPGPSNYWNLCVFLYSMYASVQYINIISMIPNNMNKKINITFPDFCSAASSRQFVTTDS